MFAEVLSFDQRNLYVCHVLFRYGLRKRLTVQDVMAKQHENLPNVHASQILDVWDATEARTWPDLCWIFSGENRRNIWKKNGWLLGIARMYLGNYWTSAGWWFGTCFYFFSYIGNGNIIPIDCHIFQRGRSTTNQSGFCGNYDIEFEFRETTYHRQLWLIMIDSTSSSTVLLQLRLVCDRKLLWFISLISMVHRWYIDS